MSPNPIHSMTGFSSVEGTVAGSRMRLELKALNHRFLDIKTRLPRELASAEMPLRSAIQGRFSRGAIEVKLERLADPSAEAAGHAVQANLGLAAHYYESLVTLQRTLGLTDPIRTIDVALLPDVLARASQEFQAEEAWKEVEPLVARGLARLGEMRAEEGSALTRALNEALDDLDRAIARLRARREECAAAYRDRVSERVRAAFEAHPLPSGSPDPALEARVAQELALILDRTDIEEELVRFKGHLDHFRKVLAAGGPVGRKLDFILQELHREVNTLGNKAQDLSISETVVAVKVRLEQLREQVMNLE